MKKNLFFLCLIIFEICSCKTTAKIKFEENIIKQVEHFENNELLKIYFPSFQNEKGKIISGDGIIIIFPDNTNMVIDGFYADADCHYVQYLKNLGIEKINYLIGTHYHSDHIGTFCELMNNFEIDNFITNNGYIDSKYCLNLIKKSAELDIPEKFLKEGDELSISNCNIKVFSPNLTNEDRYNLYYNPGKTAKQINNSSIVMKLTYNDFSILFTGDLYKELDEKLCVKYGDELSTTILKVPHHGDYWTASSDLFVKTVNAEYGIVLDNRYIGKIIRKRYSKSNTILLCNQTTGEFILTTDGKDYSIIQRN